MHLTNKYGLPKSIEDTISRQIYNNEDTTAFSVTQIIDSPKIVQLRKRHFNEITEDISERIWALLGSATHAILEKSTAEGRSVEQYFKVSMNDLTLSGVSDLLEDGTLSDFKVTSVWSIILEGGEGKKEWKNQLNCYAYLWRTEKKVDIKKLQVIAILRDWVKSKALQDPDYPRIPLIVINVPLWTEAEQKEYIANRLLLHKTYINFTDDLIPACSEEERWHKPDTYAVMKPEGKKAVRVLNSLKEAEDHITALGLKNLSIAKRDGGDKRCEEYCSLTPFCNFFKEKYGHK